jgi:hypothetical protein
MTDEILTGVESPPNVRGVHHSADHVELLCLANIDGAYSRSDLIELWKAFDDDEQHVPLDDDEVSSLVEGAEPWASKSSRDDLRERRAEDVFSHLAYRSSTFGPAYPFKISSKAPRVLRRRDNLSPKQQLYVFLLVGSMLHYVQKKRHNEIALAFERLAAGVIKAILPKGAEVHVFGTSASGNSRYSGNTRTKVKQLATDLNEILILKETAFHPNDAGDMGLDVVSWIPLGDQAEGHLVWFAQATCQTKWQDKSHQSGARWRDYLTERAPRANLLLVPFCFRTPNGEWYDPKWRTGCVLLDRQRIVWTLRGMRQFPESVPKGVVEAVLAYRSPV